MNDLQSLLGGKKGLVLGSANENSIAYGCAKAFREVGADVEDGPGIRRQIAFADVHAGPDADA